MKKGQIISRKDLKGICLEHVQLSKDYSIISLFNFRTKQIEEWKEGLYSKINWLFISWDQSLSESFIENFQDKVDWNNISRYQVLSESFIEKHQDNVDWKNISRCQKLSKSFKKKWKHKLINLS